MHDFQLNCIEDTDNTPSDPDIDHADAGVQVDGDLQVPALPGEPLILLQGILHEPVDLEKLDSASADDFELDSVLWINPCLLLANFLPVAIALPSFVYMENQSPWLPSSLQVTLGFFPLHLILFLIISMENSCLLSPLVGRSLLLPMTLSSYLHMLPLPAFISIQVAIA